MVWAYTIRFDGVSWLAIPVHVVHWGGARGALVSARGAPVEGNDLTKLSELLQDFFIFFTRFGEISRRLTVGRCSERGALPPCWGGVRLTRSLTYGSHHPTSLQLPTHLPVVNTERTNSSGTYPTRPGRALPRATT